jgi:hemoglobin
VTDSLFEQLGGHPAVDAAVDIFYRRVLKDPRVSRFFEDVDMDAQREKQKAFLSMVFGGPHEYKGKDLRKAHAKLVEQGLDDGHFDAVAEHLQATLERLDVPRPLIEQVMAIAGGTRGDVLNR